MKVFFYSPGVIVHYENNHFKDYSDYFYGLTEILFDNTIFVRNLTFDSCHMVGDFAFRINNGQYAHVQDVKFLNMTGTDMKIGTAGILTTLKPEGELSMSEISVQDSAFKQTAVIYVKTNILKVRIADSSFQNSTVGESN